MAEGSENPSVWDVCKTEGEGGTGNWRALRRSSDDLERAAEIWKQELGGVQKAWLCWNMNDKWCLLQQKLILEAGWTPIVGWDPNSKPDGPGKLVSGSLAIDFNKHLKFPVLFPHVPMELAFLWADKLAFWHADLILTREKMRKAVNVFENMNDGDVSAVFSYGGLRTLFKREEHRYWEVLGCITKSASADMFKHGCGWWRHWAKNHLNAPLDEHQISYRRSFCWDHGGGVLFWSKEHKGRINKISEKFIKEGHFSVTSKRNYQKGDSKSAEMDINFDLEQIAKRFGIVDLLA